MDGWVDRWMHGWMASVVDLSCIETINDPMSVAVVLLLHDEVLVPNIPSPVQRFLRLKKSGESRCYQWIASPPCLAHQKTTDIVTI